MKIIGILIYFIVIVGFIFTANYFIALSVDAAFQILVFAFILLIIFFCLKKFHIRTRHSLAIIHHRKNKAIGKSAFFRRTFFFLIVVIVLCTYINIKSKDTADIPDYLIEFGEKYPEASNFVNMYPKNKDKHHIIDLKNEVTKGTLPLFIQWDTRWGYEKYGNGLIGTTGCGPTCLAMVICGLTGNTDVNPLTVANFSEEHGYYVTGQGTSWDLMTEGAYFFGINVETGTVTEDYISEHLTSNTPMICSMYPGDFTYTGHFIVLSGFDSEGNIIVHDPNSYIKSRKHWSLKKMLPQIRALWSYSERCNDQAENPE